MAYPTSTYRRLAEIIINEHYNSMPTPNASITTKHVAEIIATKVAKYAKISAFGNSNAGEATYANDQFISVFPPQPLLTNNVTTEKYIVMPATPVGLPAQREITQVSFVGCPSVHVVPMANKDDFVESILYPIPFSMYKIEDGNIVFRNLPKLVTNSNAPVIVKMVGAVPGDTLLDSQLNVPKDVEDSIRLECLDELGKLYGIVPKTIQTSEPS